MSRKGQTGSTFKYLFALIIGAMFILFFIRFASQQTSTLEKISGAEFVRNFDDILTEVTVSEDQKSPFDLGREESINFEGGKISLPAKKITIKTDKIVFAPRTIKSKKITIWTRRWKWPFEITNLFYIWDGKSVSYIVYDETTQDTIEDIVYFNGDTLASMKVVIVDYKNFTKMRKQMQQNAKIIWFASKAVPKLKQKIIRVKFNEDDKETGILDFDGKEVPYVGMGTLFGAIFCSDAQGYEDAFSKAKEKFDVMRELQAERMDYIMLKKQECMQAYTPLKEAMAQDLNTPQQYALFRERVAGLNKDLEAGCPAIL